MLNLLFKDFKLMFRQDKKLSRRIISTLVSLIFIACFVAIEVVLFTTIITKLDRYEGASMAFLNLFLFILSLMLIVSGVVRANKLFFNDKDIEQLSVHPVSNSAVIFSKLVFLFFVHYATSLVFTYPIIIAYGVIANKGLWFFYSGVFYPMLSFIFEIGVALILVYPYWLLKKFLKKRILLKFIITLVILFVGCYLYANILNVFIEIIAGSGINSLFTTKNINALISLEKIEVPINFLVDVFVQKKSSSLFPFLAVSLGIFMLGATITIFAFHHVRNISVNPKTKAKDREYKQLSPMKALIKKEFILLTKNSDYSLSFTGLLIVQPFLVYMVIKALNTIFTTGIFSYYVSVVPNFIILIDLLILMLFTVIISQGASQYIQMEKRTIKVMKTIPIRYTKQVFIKVIIPFLMSVLSLVLTMVVLLIFKLITVSTFILGLFLTIILLVIYNAVALKEELSIRNKKPRSTYMSNLYSYLLPIGYFGVCAILSYFGMSMYIAFAIGFGLFIILGVPVIIYLFKNINSLFMDLDVVN